MGHDMWEFAAEDNYLGRIKRNGQYLAVRKLPDGSVAALGNLLFTRAIYMNCDEIGWSHRFCFEDIDLAVMEFAKLQSKEDVPAGYTARRPEIHWR